MVEIKYLYIKSDYGFEDTPVEAYIEVDTENYAVRYLELLKDGEIRYATENLESGTFLPYEKFPRIDDIIGEKEIKEVREITKEEFEMVWRKIN